MVTEESTAGGCNSPKNYTRSERLDCDLWKTTDAMSRNTLTKILVVLLLLILIGALPTWPYSSGWGYYPSGGAGILLIIVLVMLLM